MKKFQLLAFALFLSTALFAQTEYEITPIGHWDDNTLPTHFYGTFNDCWGYVANDREYALAGSAAYVHIFDITDPANMIEVERITGGTETVWRDMKTYQDRAYSCSDNSGEGLIIMDLSDLPNGATVTYQSDEFFGSAHDMYIDEANARLYIVGGPGSMVILDISSPDEPQLLAQLDLQDTYIHDLYVRDNIAYCSSAWDGLYVWNLEDVNNPVLLATLETNGYNHSNWVSEDGNIIIVAEEVPNGLPMLTVDATNMEDNDLTVLDEFSFPNVENAPTDLTNATPHNPYIIGDLAIVSYYEDGIVVLDLSDPSNVEKVAVFDSHPENDDPNNPDEYGYFGYRGCWGVYPFLPSGNIIATDFDHGVYVLELTTTVINSANELPEGIDKFSVHPTPVSNFLTVNLESTDFESVKLILTDVSGRTVHQSNANINGYQKEIIDVSALPAGMYFLNLHSGSQQATRKVIKK